MKIVTTKGDNSFDLLDHKILLQNWSTLSNALYCANFATVIGIA